MTARLTLMVAAAGVLFSQAMACAGFYDPVRPTSPLVGPKGPEALPWELFRDQLSDAIRIGDPNQPTNLRLKTLDRRDKLVALGPKATADELAELGMWQWRLREPDRALETLTRAKATDPRSYWPLVHLGTFFQASGQLQEAFGPLDAASAAFPSPWPGGGAAGAWFRQAEKAQLNLLRNRLREGGQRSGGFRRPPSEVDALFPVQFVGASGAYEAGKIADAERAKIPADAIATVQQLLLWFPEDSRLLWLLGELTNASGDVRGAAQIFDECVGMRRYESAGLRDHRRIVKAAVAALPTPAPTVTVATESFLPSASTLWLVGGIGGAIVALFVFLQIREWNRRRRPTLH
jgi:tetratricopeptide (TPR) repeat protein